MLVGAAQDGPLSTSYQYSTDKPADGWMGDKSDGGWKTGLAPFGRDPALTVRTEWTTPDIYLRKTFDYDGGELNKGAVVIFHDEDTEVFVNGRKILALAGFLTDYQMHDVTGPLKQALRKGPNTLALHTHQTVGGQFIDMALLVK